MNQDFKELMEKYERELMELRRHAVQAVSVETEPEPLNRSEETPATVPNAEMPPMTEDDNFQGNISQEKNAGGYPPVPPVTDGNFASLQVRVTAANEAIPIPNALVTISRETDGEPVLEQVRLTGISGLTEPVLLPATDPALTMNPSNESIPLITYEIQIAAPGYYRVRNNGVPLYGGIATVLPVTMIPLPEFEEENATELEFNTPRNNL